MNVSNVRFAPGSDVRIAWALLVLGVLATYWVITTRYEASIALASDHISELARGTAANEHLAAQSEQIEHVSRQLHESLNGMLIGQDPGGRTARFLADLSALAHKHHCEIFSVIPQASPSSGYRAPASHPSPSPSATEGPLVNQAFEVDVRGHFPNLLALIAELPRQHTLSEISGVQFNVATDANGDRTNTVLNAKITALMYHVRSAELLAQ